MSLLDTAIDAGVIPNRFEQYEEAYEKTDSLIKSYVCLLYTSSAGGCFA